MLTKDTINNLNLPFRKDGFSKGKNIGFRVRKPKDKRDLLVGYLLKNRYYVLSVLGKGGMSLVYKAKDISNGRVVAVKALRTQGLGDDTVVKRFKLEAEVLHRLNHPRIVSVYDYGTSRIGQPYFIMDYLTGVSLNQVLRKEKRLNLERFQDIFVQISAAVAHAHKHKAIHRDLKPGNIMLVEKEDTRDYVKIVDFGIAKLAEDASKLTRLGEVWGSPIYMSPEQGMGKEIDTRTDIYSLGIVMYEALTGEVPFLGKNYVETITKQMTEPPAPFSEIMEDNDIPASLEMIIFKALQKSPDDRYQTMQELKTELEKALSPQRIEEPVKSNDKSSQVWSFIRDRINNPQNEQTRKTPRDKKALLREKGLSATKKERARYEDFITTVNRPHVVAASPPNELLHPSEFVQRQSQKLKPLTQKGNLNELDFEPPRQLQQPLSNLVAKDTSLDEITGINLDETIDPGSIQIVEERLNDTLEPAQSRILMSPGSSLTKQNEEPVAQPKRSKLKRSGSRQRIKKRAYSKSRELEESSVRKPRKRGRMTQDMESLESNEKKDSKLFILILILTMIIATGFGIAISESTTGFFKNLLQNGLF